MGEQEMPEPWETPEVTALEAQLWQMVEQAEANAELHVGWVRSARPHAEDGKPGVAVHVGWLEGDDSVTAKILWVPLPLVLQLFGVLGALHSEEFKAGMKEIGG